LWRRGGKEEGESARRKKGEKTGVLIGEGDGRQGIRYNDGHTKQSGKRKGTGGKGKVDGTGEVDGQETDANEKVDTGDGNEFRVRGSYIRRPAKSLQEMRDRTRHGAEHPQAFRINGFPKKEIVLGSVINPGGRLVSYAWRTRAMEGRQKRPRKKKGAVRLIPLSRKTCPPFLHVSERASDVESLVSFGTKSKSKNIAKTG